MTHPHLFEIARSALRAGERTLPTGVLRSLLWPACACEALARMRGGYPVWRDLQTRLPRTIRDRDVSRRDWFHERVRAELGRVSWTFRDRYNGSRWLDRVTIDGCEHLDSALGNGRGVVLATAHFGPFQHMSRFLRARGYPVGVLAYDLDTVSRRARAGTAEERDRSVTPPPFFDSSSLRAACRHLERGGVLVVTFDYFGRGDPARVPVGERDFRMETGAIRIARLTGAALIPSVISEPGGWRYRVRLGAPVDPSSERDASQELLIPILQAMRAHPDQCSGFLLGAFDERAEPPIVQTLGAPHEIGARG